MGARKVLVIGLDGFPYGRMDASLTPFLSSLVGQGLFATGQLYGSVAAPTLSGPGWSTVATGVWADKHGVRGNEFTTTRFDAYPDFLSRVKDAEPGAYTFAAVDWAPLIERGVFSRRADRVYVGDGDSFEARDQAVASVAERTLRQERCDASFVYFGQVDVAGHDYGVSSPQCQRAMSKVDGHVRGLMEAIERRPSRQAEDWTVIVTTDHGQAAGGGHGADSVQERGVFALVVSPFVTPDSRRSDLSQTEVAATALDALGIPVEPAWNLDGSSLLYGSRPLAFSSGADGVVRVPGTTHAWMLRGNRYVRYDLATETVTLGPRGLADGWPGLRGTPFADRVDAVLAVPEPYANPNQAWLFRGDTYLRYDLGRETIAAGPRRISEDWTGLRNTAFTIAVDAALPVPGSAEAWLINGPDYVRYDLARELITVGPRPIADGWPGLKGTRFADGFDAALAVPEEVGGRQQQAWLIRGDSCLRYDLDNERITAGPRPLTAVLPGLNGQ